MVVVGRGRGRRGLVVVVGRGKGRGGWYQEANCLEEQPGRPWQGEKSGAAASQGSALPG